MKILYPISEITPSYGGIGSYVYKTVKELVDSHIDFEAVIITSNQQQEDTFLKYFEGIDRVKVISLFEHRYKQIFLRDIHFQLKLGQKIKRIIKKEEIDIVHHQTGHYDLFFSINFIRNKPIIMTTHGDLITLLDLWKKVKLHNFDERINYYVGKILYQEEKYLYKKSDKIIAVADHVKKNIITRYNINSDRIITIHNFVDPKIFNFHPGDFTKPYKIGFIGRPYYIKGFYDLIQILNDSSSNKDFEWHIVTDTDLIKKLVKNNEKIIYYNNIPQSKLSKFYDNVDFMFIPSYSEACPTVVIESLLKGKFCVVRDLIGIREMMKSCTGYSFNEVSQLNYNHIQKTVPEDKDRLITTLKENRDIIKKQYGSANIINSVYEVYKKHI